MSETKQKFSKEFKEIAVRLVLEKGMKSSRVSSELGIPSSYLSQWKKEYLAKRAGISQGSPGNMEEAGRRIRELEKELLIAREERDILKKAVSFFAGR